MSKFLPGQLVQCINLGMQYTSYTKMANWLGIKNYSCKKLNYNKVYKVVGTHEHSSDIVVGIEDNSGGYLISEKGLKLVSKFREGDIISDGKCNIKVNCDLPIKEDLYQLVSRKQLI